MLLRGPMGTVEIRLGNSLAVLDRSGAVLLGDCLVVADLHLEKGTSFAARGVLLPPHDTLATLDALTQVVQRLGPRRLVSLGDGFHDVGGAGRLGEEARDRIGDLARQCELVWLLGNHDPLPPVGLPGAVVTDLDLHGLSLVHEPPAGRGGWVAGHLHPKARLDGRGRRIAARCFVTDGDRLILPAFGAYTGGLDVFHPAIDSLFPLGFDAHLIGPGAIHRIARERLVRRVG
ncbi:ligase-associated DNA damage response endonuclease PdeM [Oleomonas cavernae]|uniref:Ligase-associated DNA damage response endonuclease PdeM n=1 Tax=Oleomonas cavernae TaxID=2320859 RepID=A0A418WHE5_9PROT|nr:ligase-associated DNA damage response endonuclease PdeM [Oleomonas cavernae]RJF89453.1 ligase-associated DNA damage response endonuclease PdeM [Oleomonas cavernae]